MTVTLLLGKFYDTIFCTILIYPLVCEWYMVYHDSPKKNQFIGVVKSGLSVSQAARLHDIPQRTACALWKKFLTTGSTHALPRSGHPPKVTERLIHHAAQYSRKHRREPLQDVGLAMTPQILTSTVRRVLAMRGLHRRKARRVIWKRMTVQDWQHVIWSDECYVYVRDN